MILSVPECINKTQLFNWWSNDKRNLKYYPGIDVKNSNGLLIEETGTSVDLQCNGKKNADCAQEISDALANGDSYTATFVATNKNYTSVNVQKKIKNNC
jgi:hypothetical protein